MERLRRPTFRHKRGQVKYGRRFLMLRPLVLQRDPMCQACGFRPSTQVDHVRRRVDSRDDTMDNLQGLCRPCHSQKTVLHDGGFGREKT